MTSKLLKNGLSGQTAYHTRAVLWTALKKARRHGLIEHNVVELTDPPAVEAKEFAIFTREQADAFEQAIKGNRDEALYLVALASGFRQGELLGLRWEDVDLGAGLINATLELEKVEPGLRIDKDEKPHPRALMSARHGTHRAPSTLRS